MPRDYQRTGIKFLLRRPEAALLWDPGLGKTSVVLETLRLLRAAGGVDKTLVIAPKRVCYQVWSHAVDGELAVWANFADLRVSLLHGKHKAEAVNTDADLYVVNPDGLKWLVESGALEELIRRGVNCLVIDELSNFKHPQTRRFKLLKPHLGKFKRRIGLTGSPASNGLLDLFGQVYVLDLGARLGRFITHFRTTYFTPAGFKGYEWTPVEGAEKRIYGRLKDLALSMKAEDHLDLRPLVEQNLWVTLPDEARRVYDELEDDLIARVDDRTVTAVNAAVASGKCRQVASGGLYASDEETRTREALHLHDEKTEALVELVDELQGSPLLIAYEFDHDLERIRDALGKNTPAINGHVSDKVAQALLEAWNRGELPVLCGHPAAMAHGLNLQRSGNHVCWYSMTWNLELYDQLNRRVYRQGQTKRVVVHRLLARETVDEVVAAALASKRRGQDALFEALKSRASARKLRSKTA